MILIYRDLKSNIEIKYMAVSGEFLDYVVDQFSGWNNISVRRMFGGAGLYCDGVMFGLVADDIMYLKVDETNRNQFIKAGSKPFQPYPDKPISMSYYEVPVDILENPSSLAKWAQKSLNIAIKKKK